MSQVIRVARTHLGESGVRIPLKDALAKAQQPPTKEEIAAKQTRYYQEHREEIAAKKTRYRQEHREEYNTYMRDYMRTRAAQRKSAGAES